MKHKKNYNKEEHSRVKLYKTHQGWMSSLTCFAELFFLSNKKKIRSQYSSNSNSYLKGVGIKGVGILATVTGVFALGAIATPTVAHADTVETNNISQIIAPETSTISENTLESTTPSTSNVSPETGGTPQGNSSLNNGSSSSQSESNYSLTSDSTSENDTSVQSGSQITSSLSNTDLQISDSNNVNVQTTKSIISNRSLNASLLATDTGVDVSTAQDFYNQIVNGTSSILNLTGDIDLGAAYGSSTLVMSTPHSVTINGNGYTINFGNTQINPNWTSPTDELNITFNDIKIYTASQYGAVFMNTPKLFSNPKIRLVYNNVEAIGGTAVFADTTANNGIGNAYTGLPLKTFEINGNTTITGVNTYTYNGTTYTPSYNNTAGHGAALISPAFNVIIDNDANVVLDAGGNALYNIQLQGNRGTHTISIGDNAYLEMKGATYSNIYMPSYNNGDNVINIGNNAKVIMKVDDNATDNIDFNYNNASVNNTININPGAKVTLNGPSNFSAYGTVTVNINTPSYVYLTNGGGKAYGGRATYTVNASRTSIITVDGDQKFASPLVETNTATIKGSSVKSTNTVLMSNQTGTVEDVATINNNIVQPRFETTIYMGCMADLYNPQGGAMWTWSDDWNAMSNLSSADGVDIKNTSLSFRNGFLKSGNDVDSIYQIINGTKYAGTSKVSWNLTGFVTGLQTANVTITYPDGSTDTTTMQVLVLQEPSFIRYNQVRPDESGKTNTITATDLLGNLSSDSSAIGQPIGAEWANGTGPQITSTTQVGRYNGNDAYINVQYNDGGLSLVNWPKDGKFRKNVSTIFITTNLQTTVSKGEAGTAAFVQNTKTNQLLSATVYSVQNTPVEYTQQENGTLESADGEIFGITENPETITVSSAVDASKIALSSLVNLTSLNPEDYSLSWDEEPQIENNELKGMIRAQISPTLFFSIPVTADINVEEATDPTPTEPTDDGNEAPETPGTSLPDNSGEVPVEPTYPGDTVSGKDTSSKEENESDSSMAKDNVSQSTTDDDTTNDKNEDIDNSNRSGVPNTPDETAQSDGDSNKDSERDDSNIIQEASSTSGDNNLGMDNLSLKNPNMTISGPQQNSELNKNTYQAVKQSITDEKAELPQTGNDIAKSQVLALTGLLLMFGLVGIRKKQN
ncbi:pectate lyase-like adhesive domain-containing protein [Lactobacillaceae bacterium 24-114]